MSSMSRETLQRTKDAGRGALDGLRQKNAVRTFLDDYVFDYYTIVPEYQRVLVGSRFSKLMTVLSFAVIGYYIISSLMGFVEDKPQLVHRNSFTLSSEPDKEIFDIPLIALSVGYRDEDTRKDIRLDADNNNPYFTFVIEHRTFTNQERSEPRIVPPEHFINCNEVWGNQNLGTLFCIAPEYWKEYKMQGEYVGEKYEYLNFKLNRCIGTMPAGRSCARPEEVQRVVQSRDGVQIELFVKSDQYNPETNTITKKGDGWRWFAKAGSSVQNEVYFMHQEILVNGRSGLQKSSQKELLKVSHVETYDRPEPGGDEQGEYLEFFFRMDLSADKAEVVYPDGTILSLIALWGAFFTTITGSLGLFIRYGNKHIFSERFQRSTKKMMRRQLREDNDGMKLSSSSQTGEDPEILFQSEFDEERGTHSLQNRGSTSRRSNGSSFDYPVDKMDVRLVDEDMLDKFGRFQCSNEELLIPSNVFGELRLFALEQHRRRRIAAGKICDFFRHYTKPCSIKPPQLEHANETFESSTTALSELVA